MKSGAVCKVTAAPTTRGDSASMPTTLDEATHQPKRMGAALREVVREKGYHSNTTTRDPVGRGVRN